MHPGEATAFEAVVDDYDAARPRYPAALYDALAGLTGAPLAGRELLELGSGTGIATRELLARGARLVATDLGPRMLARAVATAPGALPAVVARAEALPFADASYDGVCGAQMWHWVDVPAAATEVARVLRPGGWLAVWWNEADPDAGDDAFRAAWEAQQARLEAGNPRYSRDYRQRDHGAELAATGRFGEVLTWSGTWSRELDWPLYERWLRSKSYVQALGEGLEAFLAAERESLGGGPVVEPFRTSLWLARNR